MVDSTDHTDDTDRGLPTSEPAPSGSTRGGPPVGPAGPLRMLGFVLLLLYTVIGLIALPFTVVVAMYTPLIIGGEGNPNHPAVLPTQLVMLGVPLSILAGIIGGWVAWVRRRGRAALTFTLLPIVYGPLALVILAVVDWEPPYRETVAADEAPITLSRSDDASWRPFELRSTEYSVRWTTTILPGEPACRLNLRLSRRTDSGWVGGFGSVVSTNMDGRLGPIRTREEAHHRVIPGTYRLEVGEDAGCDWSLTLTPGRPVATMTPIG